jgi:UDPglucose--hexose-1-phosphate uridylyltransferase
MKLLNQLLTYGLKVNLIQTEQLDEVTKKLYRLYNKEVAPFELVDTNNIYQVLDELSTLAFDFGLISANTTLKKDEFEALLFNALMPSKSEFRHKVKDISKTEAAEYLYELSLKTNYIKQQRLKENVVYHGNTPFGKMSFSINVAKPEKDPKDIELNQHKVLSKTIKCVICKENEQNYTNARMNLRLLPMTLNHTKWYFQFSPYAYFSYHSIVLSEAHTPMKITKDTIKNLVSFVDQMPGYVIGSNADKPIVGGSILGHDHYQAGIYEFPIEQAKAHKKFKINQVEALFLHWPLSTIKLITTNKDALIESVHLIHERFKTYEDKAIGLINKNQDNHTITPIIRKEDNFYIAYVMLRSAYQTKIRPFGQFHPASDKWHIKKENIGLIEAAGLGILPKRLNVSLNEVLHYLTGDTYDENLISDHLNWANSLKGTVNDQESLYQAVLDVFVGVLEDCGVFNAKESYKGLERFLMMFNDNQ